MDTPTYIIRVTCPDERESYIQARPGGNGHDFIKAPLSEASKFSGPEKGILALVRLRWPNHKAEIVEVERLFQHLADATPTDHTTARSHMDTPREPEYIIQLTHPSERHPFYLRTQSGSSSATTFAREPFVTLATKVLRSSVGAVLAAVQAKWPDWTTKLVEVELPGTDAPTDRANVPPQPQPDAKPQPEPKLDSVDPIVGAFLGNFVDFQWRGFLGHIANDPYVKEAGPHGTIEQRAKITAATMTFAEPLRVAVQTYQKMIRRPSERARWYRGWLPPSAWARTTAQQVQRWLALLGLKVKVVDCQDGKGRYILAFELVALGQITPQDLADVRATFEKPDDQKPDEDNDPDDNESFAEDFADNISDDPEAARYRQSARDADEDEDADEDDIAQAQRVIDNIAQSRRERALEYLREARAERDKQPPRTAEEAYAQMRRMNGLPDEPSDQEEWERRARLAHSAQNRTTAEEAYAQVQRMNKPHNIPDNILTKPTKPDDEA